MLPLILLPSVAAEINKWILRKRGKGRPESTGGRLSTPRLVRGFVILHCVQNDSIP